MRVNDPTNLDAAKVDAVANNAVENDAASLTVEGNVTTLEAEECAKEDGVGNRSNLMWASTIITHKKYKKIAKPVHYLPQPP